MATYPSYIKPRAKGQRKDKFVSIDYSKVRVVGEYQGLFGYGIEHTGELLLAEVDGRLYPCYRRKSPGPGITTAIGQDFQFMSCKIEDAKE
jgi:hypothetical protein